MREPATPIVAALLGLVLVLPSALAAPMSVIDGFEAIEGWTASASEGAQVWIAQEPGRSGQALRIDYDLGNSAGYVIVRKTFSLSLPRNFAFTFDLMGEGPRNTFEFKLIDPSKRNVWWWRQRDLAWPTAWQTTTIRKSRLDLAWGTSSTVTLQKVGAVEFAIVAGEGGSGSVWIDQLTFEPRPVPADDDGAPPSVEASSSVRPGAEREIVVQGGASGWHSSSVVEEQTLTLDFGESREYGGLVIDWDPDDYATAFDVETSTDGERWTSAHATARGNGRRDYLYLPDSESRWLRLRMHESSRGQGYGVRALRVQPIEFSASPNRFFEHIARDERRGLFPKYFTGEQTYWTVVGVDGDEKEALLNEEGMIEVDRGSFSLEPFLWVDDRLITWNDAERTQSLEEGYLPIPSVAWKHEAIGLRVTAFASGDAGASLLYARYKVDNPSGRRQEGRLFLAVRPFQVLPPWQELNMVGGVSPIRELRYESGVLRVNRNKAVVLLTPPKVFGAASFDEVGAAEALRDGRVPGASEVADPSGFAAGVLSWDFDLAPGETKEVVVAVPFHEPYVEALANATSERTARSLVNAEQAATRRRWQTLLSRVDIDVPAAPELVRTAKSTLAYTLINRDGPAIQPGSRTYARSWIRDGAVTSAALLQMGFPAEVRDFIRWYATFQFPDGKVPCCIDKRGPDAVPEHDSNGQFVWLVGEYYRYTRDVGLIADLWPTIASAVDYMAALRGRRTTDAYKVPENTAYFGLLPESISHEGYSSHPVHAYWDQFWALAGLRAAPLLANVVGDVDRMATYGELRDAFETDLMASLPRAMAMHNIDYVPGSVELGDFDPSSTAVMVELLGDEPTLRPALDRTYARYLDEVAARRAGTLEWEAYSPYEIRNVEALTLLGRKADAHALLDWIVADRRPVGWNQWAEISWRDPKAPQFIGDMPHTWVGCIFVHALRAMLVYERPVDRAIVLGAGVRAEWIARGVSARRLPTKSGVLSFTMRAEGADAVRIRVAGDLAVPDAGIVVKSPLDRPIRRVTVDGRSVPDFAPDEVTIDRCPADVVLHYDPPTDAAASDDAPVG
jgi:hypothetical protein